MFSLSFENKNRFFEDLNNNWKAGENHSVYAQRSHLNLENLVKISVWHVFHSQNTEFTYCSLWRYFHSGLDTRYIVFSPSKHMVAQKVTRKSRNTIIFMVVVHAKVDAKKLDTVEYGRCKRVWAVIKFVTHLMYCWPIHEVFQKFRK